MALYFKLGIHKVWRACQKGKADFAFKPSDDLEAYDIILLMIMRKTKMARQAKSKVIESWLQWPPFIYRYHFFNCLIPLPALCSSTSKYHSSLCHFVQTRVIREHKPSHNPYTYAAQFQFLFTPHHLPFSPSVSSVRPLSPPFSYSKAISSIVQYSCFSKTWVHGWCCANYVFLLLIVLSENKP